MAERPIVSCIPLPARLLLTLLDFEDGNVWPTFASELSSRIPMKNVDFLNPLLNETHTIPSLDLEFRNFTPDMFPKFTPGAVQHNLYFVHIFIVSTDVNIIKLEGILWRIGSRVL